MENTLAQQAQRLKTNQLEEDRRAEELKKATADVEKQDQKKDLDAKEGKVSSGSELNRVDDDRKADDRKADDRKADDRKADDRKADDRPQSEKAGEVESSRTGLDKQVADAKAAELQNSVRPGNSKNVLDPKDLANQEREQNTNRPSSERANPVSMSAAESKLEREHVQNSSQNIAAERAAMSYSLSKNAQQEGRNSAEKQEVKQAQPSNLSERMEARRAEEAQKNILAGKVTPSENTIEHAANAEVKLEAARQRRVEQTSTKKNDKAVEKTL